MREEMYCVQDVADKTEIFELFGVLVGFANDNVKYAGVAAELCTF